jgi:hypothetical protein
MTIFSRPSRRRFCLSWGRPLAVGALGFFLAMATPVHAAQTATNAAEGRERDLGRGLSYFRLHQLPADVPPPETARVPACVVDLRYVRTDAAGAKAFQSWLANRATVTSPVFVLANGETDGALLEVSRAHAVATGVMWVGVASRNFRPDIAVQTTAADERRAYDAFEQGATMASLLTDNPGKIRYDETSLGKDRRAEPPARPTAEGTPKEGEAIPPIDAALQRAVHLHRALLALKKI